MKPNVTVKPMHYGMCYTSYVRHSQVVERIMYVHAKHCVFPQFNV